MEYNDETSVDAVLKLNTPLTHFYTLSSNPEFRIQFRRVFLASERDKGHPSRPESFGCPMACAPRSPIPTIDRSMTFSSADTSKSRSINNPVHQENASATKELHELVHYGPTSRSDLPGGSMPDVSNIERQPDKTLHLENVSRSALPSPTSTVAPVSPSFQAFSHASASHCVSKTFSALPSSIQSYPGTVALPFSLDKKIALSICGQVVTYNLDELEDDPRTIIGLLKLVSSERGNWMVVAAHYRRNKNPAAALAVVTAMVQGKPYTHHYASVELESVHIVMKEHGVQEDDLKPAYLMLSGCETDLMKITRSTDGALSEEHFKRSREWLQKVYGKLDSSGESIVILSPLSH